MKSMTAKEALKELDNLAQYYESDYTSSEKGTVEAIKYREELKQTIEQALNRLEKVEEILKYYEAYRKGVIEYIKIGHKNTSLMTSIALLIQNINKGE